MKILVKKHFGQLTPIYNSDHENLKEAKLKEGVVYECEIKLKRNYEFHKKYFALLNLCYDNQDYFKTLDELRVYLTCKSGFYDTITTPNGSMIMPKSISFAKMDNIEFESLYKKTIDSICNFIDVEEKEIINELFNYL